MAQNVVPPPVPTRSEIADNDGRVTRPWIAFFNDLIKLILSFIIIQFDGVTLPQENGLNFLSPLTATDNPGNETIDIGFAGFAPVITPDGTAINISGVLIEFGESAVIGTGGPSVTVGVTFPVPFTTPPIVTCNPDNRADTTGNFPFECIPTNITTTGFTANFTCAVLIGGGGATGIHNVVHCHWQAMGA